MASIPVKQSRFSGGEVSPLLYGDTTLPKYGASVKTALNWIPIAPGPLVSRPGTKFIYNTKNNGAVRTKGFTFPDGRSYLIELGDSYARFFRNGSPVLAAGVPFEVTTPWTAIMLPYLKFAQVGNTITITYGGQATGSVGVSPRDLVHTPGSDTGWSIGATPLQAPPVTFGIPAPSLTLGNSLGGSGPTWPAYNGANTYAIGDRVSGLNQSWISIQNANLGNPLVVPSLFWALSNDAAHPGVPVTYAFTNVVQDTGTGVVFETAVLASFSVSDALSADRPALLIASPGVGPTSAHKVLYTRIYRGSNGVLGWLADLDTSGGATRTYTDLGVAPDYTRQPPKATDPFLVGSTDNYPRVVSTFEQRRYFIGSTPLPQTIWASRVGNFYAYDRFTPGSDDDALFITIASEVLEEVRGIAPMRVALLFTGKGEWTLMGSQGAAVSRSNYNLKKQSGWGSSWRDPLKIGNGVLFNTAKNNMVRDVYPLYGQYTDIWDGDDLTYQSRHLFDGYTISDWEYQTTPYSLVWAARSDGALLSLTYYRTSRSSIAEVQQPVVAWAKHQVGGSGIVENVAVVEEAPEDAVYLVVKRTINGVTVRTHERLQNAIAPSDIRLRQGLDCATLYDGRSTSDFIQLSGGTAYAVGEQVRCVSGVPEFAASDVGASAVVLDPDTVNADGTYGVTGRIVAYTDPQTVTLELDGTLSSGQYGRFVIAASASWGLAKSTFTPAIAPFSVDDGTFGGSRGLAALVDGVTVTGADGMVTNGTTVTLPRPGVLVNLGLSYNCDGVLLDAFHPSAEIRNKFKNLVRLGFHVANASDLWVGNDLSNLYVWTARQVSDNYGPVPAGTGYFEQEVSDTWSKDGSAAFRHFSAVPCTLLAVLREMELGRT